MFDNFPELQAIVEEKNQATKIGTRQKRKGLGSSEGFLPISAVRKPFVELRIRSRGRSLVDGLTCNKTLLQDTPLSGCPRVRNCTAGP